MPRVSIPSALRSLTDGVAEVEVAGGTIGRVIENLDACFPGLKARLTAGESLAPGIAVSVDGRMVPGGLWARCEPASEIHFLPAIGGG